MSDERRKRRQEREGGSSRPPLPRKTIIKIVIAVVLVAGYVAYWYHDNHRYDNFAKCLTAHHARMYGLFYCPHCLDQKREFRASFEYVPYTECADKDTRQLTEECKVAGAKLFPSWQFNGGEIHEGVLSMEDLSARSSCSLP